MGNFIRENNLLDDGEGEYDILGLCVSELNMSELSVLLLGDLRPLTTKHEQIRKRIRDLIEKENNDMEVIKEKFAGDFQLSFDKILNEQDSEIKLFEGFSCNATVRSVVNRNFDKIIDVILRDYTPESSPSFGEAYAEVFKQYIGEMAYEVSLGFENGLNGLQILIRRYNRDYIMRTSNNEQMAGMADAMFGRTIWNKVLEWYHEFKTEKENEQKRAQEEIENERKAELDEILKKLDDDKQKDSNLLSTDETNFSEAYQDGSIKNSKSLLNK